MSWEKAAATIDSQFRDDEGLIAYRQGDFWDGGDTCQMIAFYYYARLLYEDPKLIPFIINLAQITKAPGIYIRHPKRNPRWQEPGQRDIARWNDPGVLSRDQLMPLLVAMGAHGLRIAPALRNIAKRFFRSQNGDPIWCHHFAACFIRAPKVKWAYPVLFLTDVFLVIGALIDIVKSKTKPLSGKGYKNAFICTAQAYNCMPTPLSWLARQVYRLRPGGLQGGVDLAFSAYDDPPFAMLFSGYIEKMYQK